MKRTNSMTTESLSARLGSFVANWPLGDVPTRVVDRGKASLLHNLSCALMDPGTERWPAALIRDHYREPKECSLLIASGGKGAMDGAVLVNAAVMHAGSQD